MNANELHAHMTTDAWLARLETKWDRSWRVGRMMEIVSLTPDRVTEAENHDRAVYATSAEARRATSVGHAMAIVGLLCVFAGVVGAVFTEAALGGGPWVGVPLALVFGIGVPYFSWNPVYARLAGNSYPVSPAMIAAWSGARPALEAANDENTAPAILAKMGALEAELRTIYTTFDKLVSPVDREQAERDFVQAAAMVEVLAEDARTVRNQVYSTRRAQYFELA